MVKGVKGMGTNRFTREMLESRSLMELRTLAKALGLKRGFTRLRKAELIQALLDFQAELERQAQAEQAAASAATAAPASTGTPVEVSREAMEAAAAALGTSTAVAEAVETAPEAPEGTAAEVPAAEVKIVSQEPPEVAEVAEPTALEIREGVLEIKDQFGFLRNPLLLRPSNTDVYVSQNLIRRFGLRTGDLITGYARPPREGERYHSLVRVERVNGLPLEAIRNRPVFERLTPIFPQPMFNLETRPEILSTRLINLVAPIGRGQRGLIVSPPKAGKTTILKAIANGITANYDDVILFVLLVGERPEEVTDMRRSVQGTVFSSTFDEPVDDHVQVTEMTLERAKRLVELGNHVVILMDSLTRLARAYNLKIPPSGRTLSGGIDPMALYPPKRFFGAARNIEEGGSLTIIATCLVDTGSRMDDVIYEEFKGTGNMELHLDRKLAERRIYPAIDVQRSGTRREELLLDPETLRQVWLMRRMISMLGEVEGMELLISRLRKTKTNREFLATLNSSSAL